MIINTMLARMLLADDAVFAGQARFVTSGRDAVRGTERALFGGIMLGHKVDNAWELFDGSVIFVPSKKLKAPAHWEGYRIDQILTSLNHIED